MTYHPQNLKTLYGTSVPDEPVTPEETLAKVSPLLTMPLPLKTNDPVRRRLHPWFEDFEFYTFEQAYFIYYTAAKDEIYVAVVDLFALKDLLRNVNLDQLWMIKKSKKYVRRPEPAWRIIAAYCRTYGNKVADSEASAMTFFLTRITEKELMVIAPYWQKEAAEIADRIAQRDKEFLQDELDKARKDKDYWCGKYYKIKYAEERLKLAMEEP